MPTRTGALGYRQTQAIGIGLVVGSAVAALAAGPFQISSIMLAGNAGGRECSDPSSAARSSLPNSSSENF